MVLKIFFCQILATRAPKSDKSELNLPITDKMGIKNILISKATKAKIGGVNPLFVSAVGQRRRALAALFFP